LCQSRPNATQQTPSYFDHLVGAAEQRWRHFEAERFGSLDVHNQLEQGGLLNRQVAIVSPLLKPICALSH
jgi:hypothetical protein